MELKEFFEKETGYKMSEYMEANIKKTVRAFGREIGLEALDCAMNKFEKEGFKSPKSFCSYVYVVAINLSTKIKWEKVGG